MRLFMPVDGGGSAQDIIGRHLPAFARQRVAAARAADAFEDTVANQSLQHRLEMPRRQAMPLGQRLRRNRALARPQCHVDDGGNSQDSFAREQRHEAQPTSQEENVGG